MGNGLVCRVDEPLQCVAPNYESFVCSLPARSSQEAADFLEVIGSGGALGAGARTWSVGVSMPRIREEYERLVAELVREVERRRVAGESARTIAEWVVRERRSIATRMRLRSGPGTTVLFEVRDWSEYGVGGRSFRNVEARYAARGLRGAELSEAMIAGATHPNTGISSTAIRGARYLRHGGRVVVVLSVVTTAYTLLTTPEEDLERVLHEEAGGLVGGAAGAGLAMGVCLVFGVASGGWGMLACAAIGGIGGGAAGTYAGNRVYYSRRQDFGNAGVVDAADLVEELPGGMCGP